MENWIAVGLGGCLGALVRYALSGWVVTLSENRQFPMGTFVVNIVGCLLIGVVMAIALKLKWQNEAMQAFLIGGFLGALTTFSTYSYQTLELAREQSLSMGALNMFANLIIGLLAVWLGIWLGETVSSVWRS